MISHSAAEENFVVFSKIYTVKFGRNLWVIEIAFASFGFYITYTCTLLFYFVPFMWARIKYG